jgi:hypothetical protein
MVEDESVVVFVDFASKTLPITPVFVLKEARKTHVFDGITNSSLISIRLLCNNNCIAVLDKKNINTYKKDTCILSSTQNLKDGLWDILVPIKISAAIKEPNIPKWTPASGNDIPKCTS